jgi:hypothetical protein
VRGGAALPGGPSYGGVWGPRMGWGDRMPNLLDPAQAVSIGNQAALAGWAILILLPRWDAIVAVPKYLIPLGLCLLYPLFFMPEFVGSGGGFGSLDAIATLFQNPKILAAGWLHYLAFDLFVGAWIAQDADQLGCPRSIQAGLLTMTFMFGPVGLALYLIARTLFLIPAREA